MAQAATKSETNSVETSKGEALPAQNQLIEIEIRKPDDGNLFELSKEKLDMGRTDSFRYSVLTRVLGERYEEALSAVQNFVDKEHEYPNFKAKIARLISHCIDLIYAIKAKRNFPGLKSLTRPKQQELREKYLEHFRELQATLKRVEKVERDLEIADARSTIYVIRAIWLMSIAIIILAFALEIFRGLASTSLVVADEAYTQFISYTFELLGL
jgi:uncharacterized protein YnzC (UPF0291/DUF896 family)